MNLYDESFVNGNGTAQGRNDSEQASATDSSGAGRLASSPYEFEPLRRSTLGARAGAGSSARDVVEVGAANPPTAADSGGQCTPPPSPHVDCAELPDCPQGGSPVASRAEMGQGVGVHPRCPDGLLLRVSVHPTVQSKCGQEDGPGGHQTLVWGTTVGFAEVARVP